MERRDGVPTLPGDVRGEPLTPSRTVTTLDEDTPTGTQPVRRGDAASVAEELAALREMMRQHTLMLSAFLDHQTRSRQDPTPPAGVSTQEDHRILKGHIGADLCNQHNTGRPTISVRQQILMTLWLLATPDSYRSISTRFGVPKQTVWTSAIKMCNALVKRSPIFIKWPNEDKMNAIAHAFQNIGGIPGVVGCIDGCHIPIKAPVNHPQSYINRKGFHSVLLQGTVDNKCSFIDCYAGEVGSVHDARVYRRSSLGQTIQNKLSRDKHLLGDSAYPLSITLLTPFRDSGNLTRQQTHYNNCHSKIRCTVERAFALLKGRFRRLKYIDMWRTDLIPRVVIACCVLHNICQGQDDLAFEFMDSNTNVTTIDVELDGPALDNSVRDAGRTKRMEILAVLE